MLKLIDNLITFFSGKKRLKLTVTKEENNLFNGTVENKLTRKEIGFKIQFPSHLNDAAKDLRSFLLNTKLTVGDQEFNGDKKDVQIKRLFYNLIESFNTNLDQTGKDLISGETTTEVDKEHFFVTKFGL